MDNEFETEKPFVVTTADMLEIVAGGGNGVEYVDITGLMETAAKELREKDDEIVRLREMLVEAEAELIYLRRHGKDGARWEANDSKDVWRGFAREALKEKT